MSESCPVTPGMQWFGLVIAAATLAPFIAALMLLAVKAVRDLWDE